MIYQLVLRFFGLRPEDIAVSLEYIYVLIKHLGFTYHDAYNLPVWKRTWFINKLIEENEKRTEKQKLAQAAQSMPQANNSARRLFNRQ